MSTATDLSVQRLDLDRTRDLDNTRALIALRDDGTRRRLRAAGEWDLSHADRLARLLDQHGAGAHKLYLDLSRVTFLDCACLRVLVATHERLRAAGGRLVLTGVPARIDRLITLVGLNGVLVATRQNDVNGHPRPTAARRDEPLVRLRRRLGVLLDSRPRRIRARARATLRRA